MKRNIRLKNKFMQFGYDHRRLDQQLQKMQKSADELNRLLNKMGAKESKEKN